MMLFSFFDSMNSLIELSKGVPIPFSEVEPDDSEEGAIWYDDQELLEESDDNFRKYPIIGCTELNESHHDIISYLGVDLDEDDPMYGLSICLVFDDTDKENDDNWYIEVSADDDDESRFLMIIKGGKYQFC